MWRGLFSDFGGYPVGYACMALSKIVNHCAMVHNCGLDWLDLDMNGILVLIPALANNKSLRWGENDISTNGIQALSAELQSDFLRMKGFESYSKNLIPSIISMEFLREWLLMSDQQTYNDTKMKLSHFVFSLEGTPSAQIR